MTTIDLPLGNVIDRAPGAVRAAVKDIAPLAVAVVPFGLAVGSAAAANGLTLPQLMFGAVALLAGASQLAAIQSIGRGDGILVVALVVGLINLRFVIYGAGVARWFEAAPLRRRLALAFPVVDQTFLLCQQRFDDAVDLRWRQRYFLSATAVLGGVFVAVQPIAFTLGTELPAGVGLHLAAPLTFAGLFVKSVSNRPELLAGAIAAVIVVAGAGIAGPAALPIGVVLGAAAAVTVRGRS